MFGTKHRPSEQTGWFRVIVRPTSSEWDEYEIVDAAGRHIQTEYDLEEALEAARYMNAYLQKRAA